MRVPLAALLVLVALAGCAESPGLASDAGDPNTNLAGAPAMVVPTQPPVVWINDTVDERYETGPNACAQGLCATAGFSVRYFHDRVAPLVGGRINVTGTPNSGAERLFFASASIYEGCPNACAVVEGLADSSGEGTVELGLGEFAMAPGQTLGIRVVPPAQVSSVAITSGWRFDIEGTLTFVDA